MRKTMSEQKTSSTSEEIFEMIRQLTMQMAEMKKRHEGAADQQAERQKEIDRMWKEAALRQVEAEKQMNALRQQMGRFDSRIGEIVEHMIGGDNILTQFQALGYDVNDHYRNRVFGIKNTKSSGQIDMILEDGDVAILIEVKTNLKNDDVLEHIERLEKYRCWMDGKGLGKMRYIGALACAMVEDNVIKFAQKKGMYVIVQLGNTVEIVTPPKGFKAKEW